MHYQSMFNIKYIIKNNLLKLTTDYKVFEKLDLLGIISLQC